MREATVYRVAPGPVDTWRIYAGRGREPVASFRDKSTAVRYAMRLARGEPSWSPLPSGPPGASAPPTRG
jgi:hypothetical protein